MATNLHPALAWCCSRRLDPISQEGNDPLDKGTVYTDDHWFILLDLPKAGHQNKSEMVIASELWSHINLFFFFIFKYCFLTGKEQLFACMLNE